MGQALVAIVFIFWALLAFAESLIPGAGSRPGGRGTFLCFAKETYPKERRPYWPRPLRCATGQPVVLGHGARCGTHCALGRSVRTTAASQCTGRACPSAHPRAPRPVLLGASRRDRGRSGSSLRSAPRKSQYRHDAGAPSRAERSNGPSEFGFPSERAEKHRAGRAHARRSAHASRTDSPGLIERSAPARSEFHGGPVCPSIAGCPVRPWGERGHAQQGRLFFAYFLLAKQKKVSAPPGAYPGPGKQRLNKIQKE